MNESEKKQGKAVIWGVLGTYLAAAWVALQVVEVLMDTIGLPDWVPSFALVLLILGFPIVLATAIVQGRLALQRQAPAPATKAAVPFGEPGVGPAAAAPARTAAAPFGAASTIVPSGAAGRWLTWRNVVLVGGGGFALLGLLAAGWMLMRTLGIGPAGTLVARGLIEEGERVVLADFEGDSALASAATLAFRVDLAQSQTVSAADPAYLSAVLERMARDPDSRIDLGLAREIAIRDGIKAVIAGDIGSAGGNYVLSARLVAAEDGSELAAVRETASDSTKIVGSIDKLSKKLRERLGESLRSIRANPPLADVTTGSLEALRKYSQAWDAINSGDNDQGGALLREAIALDSTFAMAWRKLATITGGEVAVEAATKAYEYRDQLTDRERYQTLGIYYTTAVDEPRQAITAYRTLLNTYPDDAVALNNLGVVYGNEGEREQAADMYRRAMEVDPLTARYPRNLVNMEYRIGRTDSARAALDRFETAMPEHPAVDELGFAIATSEHDYAAAWPILERRLESELPGSRAGARLDEAWLTLLGGRLAAADSLWSRLGEDDEEIERLDRALEWAREIDLNVRGDTARALERAKEAMRRYPPDDLPVGAWPIDDILFLFGPAGDPEFAEPFVRTWQERLRETNPEVAEDIGSAALDYLRSERLWREGRAEEAIPLVRQVVDAAMRNNSCDTMCAAFLIGTARDRAGESEAVISEYERYLSTRSLFGRLSDDAQQLHRVYLRLGQLYDEKGDAENARLNYARFVELWEHADAELQPRVEAARTRLTELLEAGG